MRLVLLALLMAAAPALAVPALPDLLAPQPTHTVTCTQDYPLLVPGAPAPRCLNDFGCTGGGCDLIARIRVEGVGIVSGHMKFGPETRTCGPQPTVCFAETSADARQYGSLLDLDCGPGMIIAAANVHLTCTVIGRV
jgi:hypothetical protein